MLLDLYVAYYSARKHKGRRSYVKKWEANLKQNMEELCDELYSRTYKPLPSKCFVVDYPKKREIFAAVFRDRIVHHLYFNYTHALFERTFIQDAYSCIKDRGTHYGIDRVKDFCRKESRNWQRKCYVLHLDVRGYFMHINRNILLGITMGSIKKMSTHRVDSESWKTWGDVLDMDFVLWLTELIVMLNPRENCIIIGTESNWDGLDAAKSMLHIEDGLGLPIGNLTSQLFSNVYLNVLDQYMKRVLKCRYYGRYVDDAVVVSADKAYLLSLVPVVDKFLSDKLGLELHRGKTTIQEVHRGVEFLGSWLLPYRTYISNHALQRIKKKIQEMNCSNPVLVLRSVNSYLGLLQHTNSYKNLRSLFMRSQFMRFGVFDSGMRKLVDRRKYYTRV